MLLGGRRKIVAVKKFVDLHNKLAETLEQGQQVAKHSRIPQLGLSSFTMIPWNCAHARARDRRNSSERGALAAWAALRLLTDVANFFFAESGSGSGRTLERSAAMARSAAPGELREVRGLRQQIAKSAALTGSPRAFTFMAPISRARGRRSRATALRQQTDPTRWRRPTIRPTRFGTAWAAAGRRPTSFARNPVRGARWSSGVRDERSIIAAAARAAARASAARFSQPRA